ncbi:hypothetical protein WA158_003094 [Blastocystis sp. Blastoise]
MIETPAKRRLSELQSSFKSPPTKRRSSFFLTPMERLSLTATELNNDEKEKQDLRKDQEFNELETRRDSLKSPNIERSKKIASMYSQVIKMSMENKITQKNTWNLNLIDHMRDILMPTQDKEETNFQKASCTLDASVKIYGCRVDDTLTTSFRVLENLSKHDQSKEKGEESIVKNTSRKVGITNTIESNPAVISMERYDLQFDVDPLFQKMSQQFDEGGAKGMLLNTLHVDNGCHIIFESSDSDAPESQTASNSTSQEPSSLQTLNLSNITSLLTSVSSDYLSLPICPRLEEFMDEIETFKNFTYTAQNPSVSSSEHNQNTVQGTDLVPLQLQDVSMDMNNDAPDPFFDMNNSIPNQLSPRESVNHNDLPNAGNMIEPKNGLDLFEEHVMSSDPSLYTYVSSNILDNMWTGPNHWKLPTKSRQIPPKKKEGSRSKPVEHVYIDFFSIEGHVDPKTSFSKPQKPTEITMGNKSEDTTLFTIPEDQHINPDTFISLFLRPEMKLRRTSTTIDVDSHGNLDNDNIANDIGLGDYIYDNDMDNTYISEIHIEEGKEEEENIENNIENNIDIDMTQNMDENVDLRLGDLLNNGRRKFDSKINYATTAKKVNIQELKQNIWSVIDRDIEKDESINPQTTLCSSISTLKGDLDKEVTAPYYFICLLHISIHF